jgi:hypothetical protein
MAVEALLVAFQAHVYLQNFDFLAQQPFVSMPGDLFFKSVHECSASVQG